MLIVLTTTPTDGEAGSLAGKIVERRLAACVQVIPNITSTYFWDGEIRRESEHLLLIKTTNDAYAQLEKFIHENHSYDVPEIAAISAEHVSQSYMDWLSAYVTDFRRS